MINAYLTDSVTLKIATTGTWGNTASEVSTTVKGRFEMKTKAVMGVTGIMVTATASLLIAYTTITHGDKVTYGSKDYTIVAIEEERDFSRRFLRLWLA